MIYSMKTKKWTTLMSLVLMATVTLGTIACSKENEKDNTPAEEPVNYEEVLVGTWRGMSKNFDEESITVNAVFNADKTGKVIWIGPVLYSAVLSKWYVSDKKIYMESSKFDEPMIWNIYNYSPENSSITVCRSHYSEQRWEVWGQFDLKKVDEGGGGSSSTKDDVESTLALVITHYSSTGRYDDSSKTCYKKTSGSRVVLYSDPSCSTLIGLASRNTDSSKGSYRVSAYAYRVIDAGSGYTRYYYFD